MIIEEPHYLRAVLATMKSAKSKGVCMNIWDRDIEAVEKAIETIDAIRKLPRITQREEHGDSTNVEK